MEPQSRPPLGVEAYLEGSRLWGDDFSSAEEQRWYDEESSAYQDLGSNLSSTESYPYHLLNTELGYKKLRLGADLRVLGIGSAHGAEFKPIASHTSTFVVVESDKRYWQTQLFGRPAEYMAPSPSGVLPVATDSFDVATCFGVLHHVCRVSAFVAEVHRALKPGGYFLVREPIISMGDWRFPRAGLTKNERGIPLKVMRRIAVECGFSTVREQPIGHKAVELLFRAFNRSQWNSRSGLAIDAAVSSLYRNVRYHRRTALEKLTPTSAFWVLRK